MYVKFFILYNVAIMLKTCIFIITSSQTLGMWKQCFYHQIILEKNGEVVLHIAIYFFKTCVTQQLKCFVQ